MPAAKRQMHLGVFVLGTGNHSAGWRYRGASTSNASPAVLQSIARLAERGKFDLFFISDGLAMDTGDHPSFISRFEPTTLIGALSAVTRHVGLGATVSTSFGEPFHVARAFASLDHLSGGRAAWNVVTSTNSAAALNFGRERLNEHDLRYEIATDSWMSCAGCGIPGTRGPSSPTRRRAPSSIPPRCARSTTKDAFS